MALSSTELEGVFLRFANCETDERLQEILGRFLVPVLLSGTDPKLITKVNELLVHINKRLNLRGAVQLPFTQLLGVLQQKNLPPLIMNITVLLVKKAYERMELTERVAKIDAVLGAIPNKTPFLTNVLLSMLLRSFGSLKIPNYREKQEALFPSLLTPAAPEIQSKLFLFALMVILIPYAAVEEKNPDVVFPSLANKVIKDVLQQSSGLTAAELESAKGTLVTLVSSEVFSHPLTTTLLVAGTADTRCSVSDAAEGCLKKLRNEVNWEVERSVLLLYALFLGSEKLPAHARPALDLKPGSLRLMLKILPVLAGSKRAANTFPLNLQVIYGALFGTDSNQQLQHKAVAMIHKICDDASDQVVSAIGGMLKQALLKTVQSAKASDLKLCGRCYLGLGKLSTRAPVLFSSDVFLLSLLFSMLEQEDAEMVSDLREGLFLMVEAYRAVVGGSEESVLQDLLLKYIDRTESVSCSVALRFSNMLHPLSHVPSRYLCLLSLCSSSPLVMEEARRGLRPSETQKLPDFSAVVKYISRSAKERLGTPSLCYQVGTRRLPYQPIVFTGVLSFLGTCLNLPADSLGSERERLVALRAVLLAQEEAVVAGYRELLLSALDSAYPGEVQSGAMEQLCGLYAALPTSLSLELAWTLTRLTSSVVKLRESTAALVGVYTLNCPESEVTRWGEQIAKLLSSKSFEEQSGGILAAGYVIPVLGSRDLASVLLTGALAHLETDHVYSVLSCVEWAGSRCDLGAVAGESFLAELHATLQRLIGKTKEEKLLIPLVRSLIYLHVHNTSLPVEETLTTTFRTSKLNLLKLNFIVGKVLSVLSSGRGCSQALPDILSLSVQDAGKGTPFCTGLMLSRIVREYVLSEVRECEGQGAAIWLLSLLKYSSDEETIRGYKMDLQQALTMLLSSKDQITQEIASEGLALLYTTADGDTKSALLSMLNSSLSSETTKHRPVKMETKIFSSEEFGKLSGQMGGGHLTTYKELCSMASDMNQPEMIYQFMHLANRSAIWQDRMGAAFGVAHLVKSAGKELEPFLARIIPRMYRYQFDPNMHVQLSMSSIWSSVVSKPTDTVNRYLSEIMGDIKDNLHHKYWRNRESASNALREVVRTRVRDDLVLGELPLLWEMVLKLLDDIKESVRQSASKTTETLSKVSISACRPDQGSRGTLAVSTILPVLLEKGVNSPVAGIQSVAMETVMKICENTGDLLADHVSVLIPALITASVNVEPKVLGQATTMFSGVEGDREKMETIRSEFLLSSPLARVLEQAVKCVREDSLATLVPQLSSLAKGLIGLPPRVLLLHAITLLASYHQGKFTPYVGKMMGAIFPLLLDRSPVIKNKCIGAVTILTRYAKESTVENVVTRLRGWYLEKDDTARLVAATLLYKLVNTAPEQLRPAYPLTVPLVQIGRHSAAAEEKAQWELVWLELGVGEHSCLLLHCSEISSLALSLLTSSSWPHRAQGAATLGSLARGLGAAYPGEVRDANSAALVEAAGGRVYPGKGAVLRALAETAVHGGAVEGAVSVLVRECGKKDEGYVSEGLQSLTSLLKDCVNIGDRWEVAWSLAIPHLTPKPRSEPEEEAVPGEDVEMKEEQPLIIQTDLQEAAIQLLGAAWVGCTAKRVYFVEACTLLAGLFKCCVWQKQPALLSTLGVLVKESGELETAQLQPGLQLCLGHVMRGVDDAKHQHVRQSSIRLTLAILELCQKRAVVLEGELLKTVLTHFRDQVSCEGNQNLKALGIEVVTFVEKIL